MRRARGAREAIHPDVPPMPRASRRARHPVVVFLSGLLTFVVLCLIAGGGLLFVGKQQFEAPGPLQNARSILVPSGQGVREIAALLEREGIIDRGWLFLAGITAYKTAGDLKAGEYMIPPSASMRDVMDILVDGKAILHRITFPEGRTSKQFAMLINEDEALTGEPVEVPPEGSLLPETYSFPRGTSRQDVVDWMSRDLDRILNAAWSRRAADLPLESPEEMLILASIVEKETGRADERARIAGVFINRLRQGMRLQSDPTILYGLYGGDAWLRPRTILRSELDAPNNPYNTYQINGLPPGPIANVGRAAIEAVANPSRTDELYFVADGTGGHVFARTLDEHNRNVARWREIERERREAAERGDTGEPAADEEADPELEAGAGDGQDRDDEAPSLRGLDTTTPQ